ncbi:MAG: hypothetical protein ACWGOX_13260, partial [Desulforhopalus sp.]
MSDSVNRRTLIKTGSILGASALFSTNALVIIKNFAHAGERSEMAAVTGTDYYQNTVNAVAL